MPSQRALAASLLALAMTVGLARASLDFPMSSGSTYALGINQRGETVGYFDDSNGLEEGFVRRKNGKFEAPIIAIPGFSTFATAINASRKIGGYVNNSLPPVEGFLLSEGTFCYFVFPAPIFFPLSVSTFISGLNDLGSFVGYFSADTDPDLGTQPFSYVSTQYQRLALGQSITQMGINVFAKGIENSSEIVGYYVYDIDFLPTAHGFVASPDGTVASLDYPGAVDTYLNGINNRGMIVGAYDDASGSPTTHGMASLRSTAFISFDYPGAVSTTITGVNDRDEVVGSYTDGSKLTHGFIGKITHNRKDLGADLGQDESGAPKISRGDEDQRDTDADYDHK
jgi:hypothetical protein